MANIARLGVILGLQTAEFSTGIEDAKRKTKDLGQTFEGLKTGAIAVGAAIAATAAKVMAFADEISDTADAYEMTIANVLDLSEALAQSGGSADDAGKILGKFTTAVNEAAGGSKNLQESFASVGVSLKDLSQLSMDQLFTKTLAGLEKMEDPIKRNATAFELMGKAIRGVDLTKLSDEMLHGVGATDNQVNAIRKLGDAFDQLNNILFKTKLIFSEVFGLALSTAEINFKGFGSVVDAVVNVIKKAFEGLIFGIGAVIEVVKMGVAAMGNVWKSLAPGGASLADLNAATGKEFLANMKSLATLGTEKAESKTDASGGTRKVTPYVDKGDLAKQNQLLKELATIEQITATYQTQLKYQAEGIQLQTDKLFMTQNEAQIRQVIYDLDKKRDEQIAQLQNKIDVAKETGADRKVIDALQAQIDKVNELTEAYKTQIVDLTMAQQNIQQSYEGGWAASFQKYQAMAIDNAAVVSQSVDALFNSMTLALTNFVRTGKFSFKDFANAIIADMVRIQMQAATSKLFTQILGMAVGAFAGSVTGTPYTSEGLMSAGSKEVAGATMTITPIGNADGGDINAGQPYYVGENGPELIVPGRSGTIIPNNKLGGMGGGVTNITNNYIDAIDTKSFEDRLYGSSKAVWAANQYANKNISNSRTRS